MPRAIVVGFEGMQCLDLTGPAEVFYKAGYETIAATAGGGVRVTSSGLPIDLRALPRPKRGDTIVIAGGDDEAIARAARDPKLRAWLLRAKPLAKRICSVCSGAFVLAACGFLDGKRAATHWSACDRLAELFPRVCVDRNAIFVVDGSIWTSAGVTTGIDMALAIVEEDRDRATADAIAARLVLYTRRPGHQSQWSDALVAPADSLAGTIAWARSNLKTIDIDGLAKRAGMSPRTFHRRCLAQLSTTPAKLVDKLRVERARDLLERRELPAKALADACGFSSAARMKRAFVRELGIGPREYRLVHVYDGRR